MTAIRWALLALLFLCLCALSVIMLAGAIWLGTTLAHAEPAECDTQLVLAIDVSGSIDDSRFALQRDGIAQALASGPVIGAATSGPARCTEVALVEWSDTAVVAVPWTLVDGGAAAERIAVTVNQLDRVSRGSTALFEAMRFAGTLFTCAACRRVIDVSGDGQNNVPGGPTRIASDLADQGITVNGLAIVAYEADVGQWYREHVKTPDGFVITVDGFARFGEAMRQKLAQEIVWARPQTRLAGALP